MREWAGEWVSGWVKGCGGEETREDPTSSNTRMTDGWTDKRGRETKGVRDVFPMAEKAADKA